MVIAKANNQIFGSGAKKGFLMAVFCLVCCAGAMAQEPLVKVTGHGMAWSDAVALSLSDFIPRASRLEAVDPNFPEDGKRVFRGVKLTRVLELAGLGKGHGLTVIGADQYVGYLTPVQAARGMLVWEADGRPVSGLRGGPLKLMFSGGAGGHASCYIWYVAALVQGRPKVPDLAVTAMDRPLKYPYADLCAWAEPLPPRLVSIAQGCRSTFAGGTSDMPVRSVSLTRLTGDLSRADSVELIPYYGPVIRLKPEALAFDARIIVRWGTQNLHPALGGPFVVVFPIEAHHELKALVPESGAVFFLKTIVVR